MLEYCVLCVVSVIVNGETGTRRLLCIVSESVEVDLGT